MVKRTLYFGSPAYLKKNLNQLKIEYPKESGVESRTIPVEDIGVVILDNPQITITQSLLTALIENNSAVINCNSKHMPSGLFMPMTANHTYTEKLRYQINATEPLKKNLWQQTVKSKINNQARVLEAMGCNIENMTYWSSQVKSGDPENYEGRAAANYWKNLFPNIDGFRRGRFEDTPNNLLNYGYAILRAVVARGLVSSGMLPAIGIHHRNKYNPFCLADDIMEPYRPYVDIKVLEINRKFDDSSIAAMSTSIKRELLVIPTIDVYIDGVKSPLMVAIQRTTASLMCCFEGDRRKILYPEMKPI